MSFLDLPDPLHLRLMHHGITKLGLRVDKRAPFTGADRAHPGIILNGRMLWVDADTRSKVSRSYLGERRDDLLTIVDREGTSRVEVAARRGIDR
jgi:hypothetical protein